MVQVTIIEPDGKLEQMYMLFVTSFFAIFIFLQVHAALTSRRAVCWMQGLFLLTKKCEGNALQFYQVNAMIQKLISNVHQNSS